MVIGRIKQTIMKLLSICLFFTLCSYTINAVQTEQSPNDIKEAVENDLDNIANANINDTEKQLRQKLIQQLKENENSTDNNAITNHNNINSPFQNHSK